MVTCSTVTSFLGLDHFKVYADLESWNPVVILVEDAKASVGCESDFCLGETPHHCGHRVSVLVFGEKLEKRFFELSFHVHVLSPGLGTRPISTLEIGALQGRILPALGLE
jgi:hypothetical protein